MRMLLLAGIALALAGLGMTPTTEAVAVKVCLGPESQSGPEGFPCVWIGRDLGPEYHEKCTDNDSTTIWLGTCLPTTFAMID